MVTENNEMLHVTVNLPPEYKVHVTYTSRCMAYIILNNLSSSHNETNKVKTECYLINQNNTIYIFSINYIFVSYLFL